MAGVDDQRTTRRQQLVEGDRQSPGIDVVRRGRLFEGLLRPPGAGNALGQARRPPALAVVAAAMELAGQGAGCRGRVADDPSLSAEVAADRVTIDVDLHHMGPWSDQMSVP